VYLTAQSSYLAAPLLGVLMFLLSVFWTKKKTTVDHSSMKTEDFWSGQDVSLL